MYLIGGQHAATKQAVPMVEYYNSRRNTWVEAFSLGDELSSSAFRDVDCVLLRVPKSNTNFSHLGLAFSEKWVLW